MGRWLARARGIDAALVERLLERPRFDGLRVAQGDH